MSETLNDDNKDEHTNNKTEIQYYEEIVNWRQECIKGNMMPGVQMLELKKININDIVNPGNGNTLLHYAANFGFYNVIRALIEVYNADINKPNYYGYTPLYYIVSNTDVNIFNFQYMARIKDLNLNVVDMNGLSILVHSIIAKFHYAFLYFSYLGLIDNHKNDKYSNPLIYFAIVNNNKFALSYLLLNKKNNINDRYYNNTSCLSDVLITNKNNSVTKFLVKYFNEEINLNSIHTCKKSLLNFPFYNIFNYELLNTLYFFKTKNFFKFFTAIIKKHSPKFNRVSNQRLLEDNLVNNDIGYKFKLLNLKYMLYDLILPNLSKRLKLFLFLLYIIFFYFGSKRNAIFYQILTSEEAINLPSIIYKILSLFILFIWFLMMFSSNDLSSNNINNYDIESEIANTIKNGNAINLPYIDEICPACAAKKSLKEEHCFRCKRCFKNKFFHSNLFQICITKYNIKRYLIYLLLKINFYFICLFNCLEKNETNKSIFAFFYMFRFKTEYINAIWELFIGFFIFKEIGHFLGLLFSLSVETPYQYIYKYHKKVYPLELKEKNKNNMIVQIPEINNYIPIKTAIKNIIKNIF